MGYATFKCTGCLETYSTRFLWDEDQDSHSVWLSTDAGELLAHLDSRGTESGEGLCVWCEDDEQPHEADIGMIEDDDG